MSATEFIDQPKLKPGESIKDWNRRRREEIASKRYVRYHRAFVDVASGTSKVRLKENYQGDS